MNYEELYRELQAMEKELKDRQASAGKYVKNTEKEAEKGDVKGLAKDLNTLSDVLSNQLELVNRLKETLDQFDVSAYLEQGDFAGQLLELCREKGINVQGEFPSYEMFPYRVRIDSESQDVYLDKKRIPCVRPAELAKQIKLGQDKLMKASFNAQSFLGELSAAYDLAIMKGRKVPGADLYLTNLYKFMTPMARARKEYDLQSFAFDLARLYISGEAETKDGRKYQFGPSRNNNKAVRILDGEGREQFLSTIRFFEE